MDQATLSKKAAATYLGISLRGLDRLMPKERFPLFKWDGGFSFVGRR
jgi:hypothetical protein